MVEINNQRKAFLDMLAWSEGTDNGRQKTRNHGYDVIVGGELFTDYSDHPRKPVTLNPKPKSGAGRYQLLSCWWMLNASSLAWKDFSPKSQDAVALQQIKERGAFLPMIDRGGYPSGNRPLQQYLGFNCRALVMYCSEHKADSLIAKFSKAAKRPERLMYEQSHRDYLRLVICIIVCLSWAVNHYRDNAITYKAQRDKNARELKLANAAITDMQMRVSVMLLRSMQNTRRS